MSEDVSCFHQSCDTMVLDHSFTKNHWGEPQSRFYVSAKFVGFEGGKEGSKEAKKKNFTESQVKR